MSAHQGGGDSARAMVPVARGMRRGTFAVRRLLHERALQDEFRRIHRAGARAVGMCIAELLDHLGADAVALDFILSWRRDIDPDVIRWLAGDDFPRRPLHPVRAA